MKRIVQLVFTLYFVSSYVACTKVKFADIPDQVCLDSSECVETNGLLNWTYTQSVGSVDILFVDDNSGSMSTEQSKMANKFSTFVNKLDSKNINYQIAVITTDVSSSSNNGPSAANGNGAFQDGKFLSTDGKDILTSSYATSAQRIDWFKKTIQRQETLDCENANYAAGSCPSGDERGIYAVNLALDRADTRFFRKDSHLAIVILSDEDERGDGSNLQDYDLAETLVSKFQNQFQSRKTLSVHSLIIQPGDQSCLNQQNSQGAFIWGQFGTEYAKLSKPDESLKLYGSLKGGVMGSICSSDYGAQLADIGDQVVDNTLEIQLKCNPVDLDVTISPDPGANVSYSVDDSNLLSFTGTISAGSNVDLKYSCQKL